MSMPEFTDCFTTKVADVTGGTIQWAGDVSEDTIRSIVAVWNSLSDRDKLIFSGLLGITGAATAGQAALKALFGDGAVCLLVFLGAVSWGILLGSMADCAGQTLGAW